MTSTNAEQLSVYISADTDDEAAEAAIAQFKSVVVARGFRGFSLPECTHVDVVLLEGSWTKAYEFTAELLPAVS